MTTRGNTQHFIENILALPDYTQFVYFLTSPTSRSTKEALHRATSQNQDTKHSRFGIRHCRCMRLCGEERLRYSNYIYVSLRFPSLNCIHLNGYNNLFLLLNKSDSVLLSILKCVQFNGRFLIEPNEKSLKRQKLFFMKRRLKKFSN